MISCPGVGGLLPSRLPILLSRAIIFLLYPLTLVLGPPRRILMPLKLAPTLGLPTKLPLITGELLLGRSGLDRDSASLIAVLGPLISSEFKV